MAFLPRASLSLDYFVVRPLPSTLLRCHLQKCVLVGRGTVYCVSHFCSWGTRNNAASVQGSRGTKTNAVSVVFGDSLKTMSIRGRSTNWRFLSSISGVSGTLEQIATLWTETANSWTSLVYLFPIGPLLLVAIHIVTTRHSGIDPLWGRWGSSNSTPSGAECSHCNCAGDICKNCSGFPWEGVTWAEVCVC